MSHIDDAAQVLTAVESQEPAALDHLFSLLYDDLRGIAARCLRDERKGHSLQPTALVHELYVRLAGGAAGDRPRSRPQFLALAARAMRRALVDQARHRRRVKRGGEDWVRVSLDPDVIAAGGCESRAVDILALDAAIEKLARRHERQARVVELRAFAGMTIAETAALLAVSTDTVEDDWALARSWTVARAAYRLTRRGATDTPRHAP